MSTSPCSRENGTIRFVDLGPDSPSNCAMPQNGPGQGSLSPLLALPSCSREGSDKWQAGGWVQRFLPIPFPLPPFPFPLPPFFFRWAGSSNSTWALRLLLVVFLCQEAKGDLWRDLDREWAVRNSTEAELVAACGLLFKLARDLSLFVDAGPLVGSRRRKTYAGTGRLVRMSSAVQGLLLQTNLHKRFCSS